MVGIKKYLKYSTEELSNFDTIQEIFQNEDLYDDRSAFIGISEKITNIIITKANFEPLIIIALKYDLKWLLQNCLKYLNDNFDIRIDCDEFRVLSIDVFYPEPNVKVVSNLIEQLFNLYKRIFNLNPNVHKINLLIHWEDNRIHYRNFIKKYKTNIQSITYMSSIDIPSYFKHFIYQNCKNLVELTFVLDPALFVDFDLNKYSLNKLKSLKLKWIDKKIIKKINFSSLPHSIESLELEFSSSIKSIIINDLDNLRFIKIFSFFCLEVIEFSDVPNLLYVEVSNCPKLTGISGVRKDVVRTINSDNLVIN